MKGDGVVARLRNMVLPRLSADASVVAVAQVGAVKVCQTKITPVGSAWCEFYGFSVSTSLTVVHDCNFVGVVANHRIRDRSVIIAALGADWKSDPSAPAKSSSVI